jgi:hypothetical protein
LAWTSWRFTIWVTCVVHRMTTIASCLVLITRLPKLSRIGSHFNQRANGVRSSYFFAQMQILQSPPIL